MSEFEKVLEKLFMTAFYAGRLYTFKNSVSTLENMDSVIFSEFWRYENIPNEHGITLLDLVKRKVLVDKEDLAWLIENFIRFTEKDVMEWIEKYKKIKTKYEVNQ